MKDPYVLENGTLKNLLNIEDENLLNQAEADIGFGKLINVSTTFATKFDTEYIRNIHKHIFSDIYDWAGEYRKTPIYKEEIVLPGLSLEYGKPEEISVRLEEELKKLNETNWENKTLDELSLEFAKKLARIWRVHPFRDGNTRTTLAFADIYSRAHGFPLNMGLLLDNLVRKEDARGKITQYSIRDKFVLAALDEKYYPEPEHLAGVLKESIQIGALPKLKNNNDEREMDEK